MKRAVRIWVVTRLVFLEALRRKDIYVLLTLAFMMTGALGCMAFYGIEGFDVFFRDMAGLIVNITLAVIVVVVTARQFPGDLETRMLEPLLARGVSRMEYTVGKFAGCFTVGVFAVSVLHIKLMLALGIFGVEPGFSLVRVLYLRLAAMAVIIGMVFFLSQFLRYGANVGVSLGVCALAGAGSAGMRFALEHSRWLNEGAARMLSAVGPHVALFDLNVRWGAGSPAALGIYAVVYGAAFLLGAGYCLGRRRM